MARTAVSRVVSIGVVLLFVTSVLVVTQLRDLGCLMHDEKSVSSKPVAQQANKTNMFDVIKEKMFQVASAPKHTTNREKFSLQGWKRGSGGLMDTDRLLLGSLYYNATSVFEFGLGESTNIAAHVGVPRFSGVDSDAVWVEKARSTSKMTHFRFSFADIGDIKMFGNPTDNTLQKIPYDYQISPLADELDAFDVYLVDGRYRVACACLSLLHAMRHGGDMSKIVVAVHDYDDVGRGFQQMERIADVVDKSQKLAVFKVKNTTTEDDIYELWEENSWTQS